jgi:hypothetical protein
VGVDDLDEDFWRITRVDLEQPGVGRDPHQGPFTNILPLALRW